MRLVTYIIDDHHYNTTVSGSSEVTEYGLKMIKANIAKNHQHMNQPEIVITNIIPLREEGKICCPDKNVAADKRALDWITSLINEDSSSNDLIPRISEILRLSGRDVNVEKDNRPKHEYFVETYNNAEYGFEDSHMISNIEAVDDAAALKAAEDVAKDLGHTVYQIETFNGYEDRNLPQPIWNYFNGFLR